MTVFVRVEPSQEKAEGPLPFKSAFDQLLKRLETDERWLDQFGDMEPLVGKERLLDRDPDLELLPRVKNRSHFAKLHTKEGRFLELMLCSMCVIRGGVGGETI